MIPLNNRQNESPERIHVHIPILKIMNNGTKCCISSLGVVKHIRCCGKLNVGMELLFICGNENLWVISFASRPDGSDRGYTPPQIFQKPLHLNSILY